MQRMLRGRTGLTRLRYILAALFWLAGLAPVAAQLPPDLRETARANRERQVLATKFGQLEVLAELKGRLERPESADLCLAEDGSWVTVGHADAREPNYVRVDLKTLEVEPLAKQPGTVAPLPCAQAPGGVQAVRAGSMGHDAWIVDGALPRGVDYNALLDRVIGTQLALTEELLVEANRIAEKAGDPRLKELALQQFDRSDLKQPATDVRIDRIDRSWDGDWAVARAHLQADEETSKDCLALVPLQRGGLTALPLAQGSVGQATWAQDGALLFVVDARLLRLRVSDGRIAAEYPERTLDDETLRRLAVPNGWVERLHTHLVGELASSAVIRGADQGVVVLENGMTVVPWSTDVEPATVTQDWIEPFIGVEATIELPPASAFAFGYREAAFGNSRFEDRPVGAIPLKLTIDGQDLAEANRCRELAGERPIFLAEGAERLPARRFQFAPPLPAALADDPPQVSRCTARVTVDAEGRVDLADVIGCVPRQAGLEELAQSALLQWRYEPLVEDGCPRRHLRVEAIEFDRASSGNSTSGTASAR